MPSSRKMLLDLTLSISFMVGGAWVASQTLSPSAHAADATRGLASDEQVEQTEASQARSQQQDFLSIHVSGLRNQNGKVLVLVFDQAESYEGADWTGTTAFAELPADSNALQFQFPELRDGPFAIFVLHDENADYDLAMNGEIPLEGFTGTGIQNWYETPSFEAAAVEPGLVQLSLHYAR